MNQQSRFFATVSDSDSESSSSEEEQKEVKAFGGGTNFQISDDEEDTKRVVRSSKEKRYEELTKHIKQIRNHKKIKDMSKMLTGFEDLTRAFTKAKPIIDKQEHGLTPKFYLKCLVEMDDFVVECWEDREGRKNMSKNNSKSLGTLRQKLRKYLKDFEKEIQTYRENPEIEEEEQDDDERGSESDSEDDEDAVDSFKKATTSSDLKSKLLIDNDESDDDSYWESSGEESSSSSSDDEKYAGNLAAKFLKKTTEKEDKPLEKKKKEKKDKKESRRRDEDDGGGEWEEVKDGVRIAVKPKMFAKDAEINHVVVVRKLNEILAARGKKGTDRSEQIELLQELFNIAKLHELGPAISVKITLAIIASIYDYNPNIATCMRTEMWLKCTEYVVALLTAVTENVDITIGELIPEDSEVLNTSPYRIRGCALAVVERMDEEFIKMLQGCDAHSPEYVERLKDEKIVCSIIERLQAYLENRGTSGETCRVYLRRIEHIYYKFDPEVFKDREQKQESKTGENSIKLMNRLCKFIYAKDNTDRIRTRAMLCHIYHHALHDNWFEARDLMLMSHLQDSIHHSDVPTQILYNRTMVQLGLSAFRHGNIKDAHNALLDIQSGGRAKELLAQGLLLQRQHERSSEQEKIEKRRQMPFHMHINLELLECVYLVSAMLMEIPYMAAHEFDTRRRIISKSFNHQLKISDRQALVGPPESMREHVVAAAKAMRNGNWEACRNFIINEKMNAKVWTLFHQADKVREMLSSKIQEETLRTYLFTYSSIYDSISMVTLAEMFKLDKAIVHSIISKMIINEELMVSLDEPSQTVVMHRTEPTRLQSLALQLADKLSSLVENNERTFEMKQGSFFTRGQQGYQRQGGYGRQQGYQQGGRRQQRQY